MKNYKKLALFIPALLLTGCSGNSLFGKTVINGSGEEEITEFKDLIGESITVEDIDCTGNNFVEVNIHYSIEEKKIVLTTDSEIATHLSIRSENKEIKISGRASEEYNVESIKIDIYGYTFSTLDFSIAKATIEAKALSEAKFELNAEAVSNVSITGTYTLQEGVKANITASGTSKINISNITCDEIEYNISGVSDVYVGQDNANKVTAYVSGVSKLTHGSKAGEGNEVEEMNLNLSGTSQYYAFYRYAKKVSMNISGASSAKTRAIDELNVSASGASICYYLTTNENLVINQNLSGGSKLQQA